ncbi:sigma 54-interacting transcriptional regulator [Chondromyces crocatus]|uniref:ATPase AAA n=1 Tax=Chondromyces crocatus TaxID=52 RepID=A0A0K1EN68_CHOCO|nr:sigma 54-interacting transcriptional regulator [Chondromyces crocatus]AKT42062.1 ATPase AAA [Chondromyces crocatus]
MNKGQDADITAPADDGTPVLKFRSNKLHIRVEHGPDAGVVAELSGHDARIGSAKECDLVLTDRAVSRVHLRIRLEGDTIRVTDEDSRNGTTIDGVRIRDAYARPDSSIQLGNTQLRLRMLSDLIEFPVSSRESFGQLRGRSVAMRRLFGQLESIAPTDLTVLIEGETGTGKDLVARALHGESARAQRPFVIFDCSAVSAHLFESELFGHVRGAFTGAVSDRPGALEAADGGTLFLDEIGELPQEMQPKLLRALESLEVHRVGSNKVQPVDVRIIAATNRSLSREVERGSFREDLFFRIAKVHVRIPPLRERPADIPLLARHFEQTLTQRARTPLQPLSDAIVRAFAEKTWAGNVRELRSAVELACHLGVSTSPGTDAPLASDSLEIDTRVPLLVGRDQLIDTYVKRYLEVALEKTGGNVSRTAELAGVGRKFVQQAMRRYGLRDRDQEAG